MSLASTRRGRVNCRYDPHCHSYHNVPFASCSRSIASNSALEVNFVQEPSSINQRLHAHGLEVDLD